MYDSAFRVWGSLWAAGNIGTNCTDTHTHIHSMHELDVCFKTSTLKILKDPYLLFARRDSVMEAPRKEFEKHSPQSNAKTFQTCSEYLAISDHVTFFFALTSEDIWLARFSKRILPGAIVSLHLNVHQVLQVCIGQTYHTMSHMVIPNESFHCMPHAFQRPVVVSQNITKTIVMGILPAHACSYSWLRQRCAFQVDIDRYYKQRLG